MSILILFFTIAIMVYDLKFVDFSTSYEYYLNMYQYTLFLLIVIFPLHLLTVGVIYNKYFQNYRTIYRFEYSKAYMKSIFRTVVSISLGMSILYLMVATVFFNIYGKSLFDDIINFDYSNLVKSVLLLISSIVSSIFLTSLCVILIWRKYKIIKYTVFIASIVVAITNNNMIGNICKFLFPILFMNQIVFLNNLYVNHLILIVLYSSLSYIIYVYFTHMEVKVE